MEAAKLRKDEGEHEYYRKEVAEIDMRIAAMKTTFQRETVSAYVTFETQVSALKRVVTMER